MKGLKTAAAAVPLDATRQQKEKEKAALANPFDMDDDDMDDDDDDGKASPTGAVSQGDDDDDKEDDIAYQVYHSHTELMRKTENALKARDKKKEEEKKAPKRKRKPSRAWKPSNDYQLVRDGIELNADPDSILSTITERHLYLFKHVDTDPPVSFATDPQRPLWVGVFRMNPGMGPCGGRHSLTLQHAPDLKLGYTEDQYYNPKQTQLKAIYACRDKGNQPEDNLIVTRDGMTLPYYVDAWETVKRSDRKYKENSRLKKEAEKKTLPVAPAEEGPLMPLGGWFGVYCNKKEGPTLHSSGVLRANPASALMNGRGAQLICAMKPRPREETSEPAPDAHDVAADVDKHVAANVDEHVDAQPSTAKKVRFAAPPPPENEAPSRMHVDRAAAAAGEAAPSTRAPTVTTNGNLRLCKLQFLSEQMKQWNAGSPKVVSACREWFSGQSTSDPDELLSAFVRYVETPSK